MVPPKGDDAAAGVVEAPNPPPKPDVPAVAVLPPNKLPPVVAAGVPKPPVFAPNALFVVLPKAPVVLYVSTFIYLDLRSSSCGVSNALRRRSTRIVHDRQNAAKKTGDNRNWETLETNADRDMRI